MLVKNLDAVSDTMEQKQQRQDRYEDLVLFAAPFNKGKCAHACATYGSENEFFEIFKTATTRKLQKLLFFFKIRT